MLCEECCVLGVFCKPYCRESAPAQLPYCNVPAVVKQLAWERGVIAAVPTLFNLFLSIELFADDDELASLPLRLYDLQRRSILCPLSKAK